MPQIAVESNDRMSLRIASEEKPPLLDATLYISASTNTSSQSLILFRPRFIPSSTHLREYMVLFLAKPQRSQSEYFKLKAIFLCASARAITQNHPPVITNAPKANRSI